MAKRNAGGRPTKVPGGFEQNVNFNCTTVMVEALNARAKKVAETKPGTEYCRADLIRELLGKALKL